MKKLFPSVNPRKVLSMNFELAHKIDDAFENNDYFFFRAFEIFLDLSSNGVAEFITSASGEKIFFSMPIFSEEVEIPTLFSIHDIWSNNKVYRHYLDDGSKSDIDLIHNDIDDNSFPQFNMTTIMSGKAILALCPIFNYSSTKEIIEKTDLQLKERGLTHLNQYTFRCLHKILERNDDFVEKFKLMNRSIVIPCASSTNANSKIMYIEIGNFNNESSGYRISLCASSNKKFRPWETYVAILYCNS